MQIDKFKLILASQSPRRKELLQWTFLPFKIIPSGIDEVMNSSDPIKVVEDLAFQKASDIFNSYPKDMVIGADTIVVNEGKILGKPKDVNEARKMLLSLSGKGHDVYTGVAILFKDHKIIFHAHTKVIFKKIPEDLLELYLATQESLDKAGAYGIQGAALGFIERVEGSYSNVVGLPVDLVLEKIQELLIEKYKESWRLCFQD